MTEIPQAAYVHVPFCVHRCGYCDFTVVSGRDDLLESYLDALEIELRHTLLEPRAMRTLFLGGGTPTYLPATHLERLLAMLRNWLPVDPAGEFSVECNPEQFTPDRMDVLVDFGVNRFSLGVQSFHAEHLRTLERSHSPEMVAEVVEQLRRRNIGNISLDLIFAVPGQTGDEWRETMVQAVSLAPEHLSTYGLTYEKGTRFWTSRLKSELIPAADELERWMYDLAMTLLPEQGYAQYELSNFARPGFACRHNQVYWNGESYYGFGPGAASYGNGIRRTNHRSTTTWIRRLLSPALETSWSTGSPAVADQEELTFDLRRREAVMLGLRKISGIDLEGFGRRYQSTLRDLAPGAYDQFIEDGLLEESAGFVRLTYDGRFLADTIVSEFL